MFQKIDLADKILIACMVGILIVSALGIIFVPPQQPKKFYCDCNPVKVECKCCTVSKPVKAQ